MNVLISAALLGIFNLQIIQCVLIKVRTDEEILNGIYLNGVKKREKRFLMKQFRKPDGSVIWDRKYRKGLWNPDEPIEYGFDGSLTYGQKQYVHIAVQYWQNNTCLNFKFVEDEHFEYRVIFRAVNQEGCNSFLGRGQTHGAVQFVSLGPSCMELDLIVHEVGHTLGLVHEHQRPDRDDHLNIFWWNIEPAGIPQFEKVDTQNHVTMGLPFDHGSIMHYGSHVFGLWKFFGLPPKQVIQTIKKAYQLTIGAHTDISFLDLKGLHLVYCADRCARSNMTCERGGFLNPRNCKQCVCPHGFAGRNCSEISPHAVAKCGGVFDLTGMFHIKTPTWPREFYPLRQEPQGQSCTWLLRAPAGQVVEMRIRGGSKIGRFFGWFFGAIFLFNIAQRYSSCLDYVEVKNSTDFTTTGMRFCGTLPPIGPIYSEGREMLVLFRTNHRASSGFGAFINVMPPENKSQEELDVHDFFALPNDLPW